MLGLGGGLAAKLLAVFDYVKVRAVGRQSAVFTVTLCRQDVRHEAQQWKLTSVQGVRCPELGPELEQLDRCRVSTLSSRASNKAPSEGS